MSETKEKVESTAYVGKHLTPAPWNESTAETISDAIEKLTTEGRVISDELIALTVKEEEVTATAVKEHLAPSQLDEGGATNALEVLPAVADVGETFTISTEGMQYNDPRDFVKCSSIDELRLKLQKGRICYTFYSA